MNYRITVNPDSPKVSEDEAYRLNQEFERIRDKHGILTPKIVVQEAKPSTSPLHHHFTWNNERAAERFREIEASRLIRVVYIQLEGDKGEPEGPPTRGWVPIKAVAEDEESLGPSMGYMPQREVYKVPSYRQQVLDYASTMLRTWRKKFGHLQEFYDIANAIDKYLPPPEE